MTAFDLMVVVVVGLSLLIATLRGFVRSAVSLAAWVLALLLTLRFGPDVAASLGSLQLPPGATQALGYGLTFLAVVIAGSLAGLLLARLLQAVGLGPLDRLLGALFGLARGLLLVLAGTLVAGVTDVPKQDWWQNSILAPHFAAAALSMRPYLPRDWADRLDYSAAGSLPTAPGPAAGPGVQRI